MLARVKMKKTTVALQFSIPLLIFGILTVANADSQNYGLPPGYTAYPEVGVAYKYYSNGVSWHEARKRCPSEGGYLAVIDSQQKFDIIQRMRMANVFYTWIGIHNFYDWNEWCGVNNGLPVSFFTWLPNYPKDIDQKHCVVIMYSNGETKHYNENCANSAAYVCEIPIMKHCN